MKEEPSIEKNPILNRIVKESGVPDFLHTLLKIPNTDFQSLLLETMEEKSLRIGVSELNLEIKNNSFIRVSEVSQQEFSKFDGIMYDLLPSKYRSVDLSPLVPFATNKVLANISQKRVLSTTRNAEVLSDPTTALAMHCAQERTKRIKEDSKNSELVALATSQRVIRQDSVKRKGYSQHFRTFTLATAGRDAGFEKFEKDNLKEHLYIFLSLFRKLNESGTYSINEINVSLSDVSEKSGGLLSIINESTVAELTQLFPEVIFTIDSDRKSNYYKSLCYSITAKNTEAGDSMSIAGGGITNWSEILVGSRKERLLVGSVGSETLCGHFKN